MISLDNSLRLMILNKVPLGASPLHMKLFSTEFAIASDLPEPLIKRFHPPELYHSTSKIKIYFWIRVNNTKLRNLASSYEEMISDRILSQLGYFQLLGLIKIMSHQFWLIIYGHYFHSLRSIWIILISVNMIWFIWYDMNTIWILNRT